MDAAGILAIGHDVDVDFATTDADIVLRLGTSAREPRYGCSEASGPNEATVVLHLGWRFLLAVSLAASPWIAALSSATSASHMPPLKHGKCRVATRCRQDDPG